MATIPEIADRLPQLFGFLRLRGIEPAGPPFLKYNVVDMDGVMVMEAGVPVAAAPDDHGDIFSAELPAGRYAVVVHHGHPAGLMAATADLLAWAQAQGLVWDKAEHPDGDHWVSRLENYLTDPTVEPDLDNWDTELAFRLADS
jgi:effector-binding domain-containing protein